MALKAFEPDYLCNDSSCKSREVIRDMAAEYQSYMNGAVELLRQQIAEAEGCPSEQRESCELGDVCACAAKARQMIDNINPGPK
jgi:hypothetical protein